jgi:hypothetical protein
MTHTTARDAASVALALLDQHWPPVPDLEDGPAGQALARLQADPRYLIGRLQQAMTALLASALPPMDPHTALLSQALKDAIDSRTNDCDHCGDDMCPRCSADRIQADRYHELARALGAMGDPPAIIPPRADQPEAAQDDSLA